MKLSFLVSVVAAIQAVAASPIPVDVFPVQQRIALGKNSDEMSISWNTLRDIRRPRVYYGLSEDSLDRVEYGMSSTYSTSWTYSNHVTLKGLEPNTTYYYKVSYSEQEPAIRSFTTPPVVGKDELDHEFKPFTFASVADLGHVGTQGLGLYPSTSEDMDFGIRNVLEKHGIFSKPPVKSTFESLVEHVDEYDFVWHNGDIAYADNFLEERQPHSKAPNVEAFNRVLNAFYDSTEPVSSFKPYMVGPGNHDINCGTRSADIYTDAGQECGSKHRSFAGYLDHYRMPSGSPDPEDNLPTMWYSFDYYSAHFIQINTELEFGMDGDPTKDIKGQLQKQREWLKRDLESVDRKRTPWVIVEGHRPWYASAKNACPECQEGFEDLLNEYNVDLVLFGHVHNYQRNQPIGLDGEIDPAGLNNPKAPWYIINGSGGQLEGLDPVADKHLKDYLVKKIEEVLGWAKITVHNSTHLTYEFIASVNGTTLDEATLVKVR
ncbi:hypothetical protein AWJ20_4236 [Sugiyamaella lignohabitans]|uniref:Purple acid phosphatase n=1 Tax=Sugiyamaella lignohabitans TaxID=796027 RepID=A0A167CAD4_9ASCO|nr:uncharacterized protein AWJ20_4236 [Sugiyamaella lignohabitans]ANB11426.1 hypothetical protein AWJ20_4236 [Sugiyamaella lignohabitans]